MVKSIPVRMVLVDQPEQDMGGVDGTLEKDRRCVWNLLREGLM